MVEKQPGRRSLDRLSKNLCKPRLAIRQSGPVRLSLHRLQFESEMEARAEPNDGPVNLKTSALKRILLCKLGPGRLRHA